jgi:RES domain-containing protein
VNRDFRQMSLQHAERVFDLIDRNTDVKVLEVLFGHLVANQPLLGFAHGRGPIFWRARICPCPNGFDSLSEVIHPPRSRTGAGRLNDPGEPVFYASNRDFVALAEKQPTEGEYVHLLGVRICPSASVQLMAIGELFHVYKAGFSRFSGTPAGDEISRQLNYMGFEFGTRILFVDAFLSHVLADPHSNDSSYVRTRALRTAIYSKINDAEGFFYPSIFDRLGTNLVVNSRTFDTKFQATSSRVVRIDRQRRFGFYDTTNMRHACGVAIDGSFEWLSHAEKQDRIIFNMTPQEEKFCRENRDQITPETYPEFMSLAGMPDHSR